MLADSHHLEKVLLQLLQTRGEGKTVCPSEVARSVSPQNWRPLMQPVREAASSMIEKGKIEATQKGRVVNLKDARGPVRLRLSTKPGEQDF